MHKRVRLSEAQVQKACDDALQCPLGANHGMYLEPAETPEGLTAFPIPADQTKDSGPVTEIAWVCSACHRPA
jgi:hypothetical protein